MFRCLFNERNTNWKDEGLNVRGSKLTASSMLFTSHWRNTTLWSHRVTSAVIISACPRLSVKIFNRSEHSARDCILYLTLARNEICNYAIPIWRTASTELDAVFLSTKERLATNVLVWLRGFLYIRRFRENISVRTIAKLFICSGTIIR